MIWLEIALKVLVANLCTFWQAQKRNKNQEWFPLMPVLWNRIRMWTGARADLKNTIMTTLKPWRFVVHVLTRQRWFQRARANTSENEGKEESRLSRATLDPVYARMSDPMLRLCWTNSQTVNLCICIWVQNLVESMSGKTPMRLCLGYNRGGHRSWLDDNTLILVLPRVRILVRFHRYAVRLEPKHHECAITVSTP